MKRHEIFDAFAAQYDKQTVTEKQRKQLLGKCDTPQELVATEELIPDSHAVRWYQSPALKVAACFAVVVGTMVTMFVLGINAPKPSVDSQYSAQVTQRVTAPPTGDGTTTVAVSTETTTTTTTDDGVRSYAIGENAYVDENPKTGAWLEQFRGGKSYAFYANWDGDGSPFLYYCFDGKNVESYFYSLVDVSTDEYSMPKQITGMFVKTHLYATENRLLYNCNHSEQSMHLSDYHSSADLEPGYLYDLKHGRPENIFEADPQDYEVYNYLPLTDDIFGQLFAICPDASTEVIKVLTELRNKGTTYSYVASSTDVPAPYTSAEIWKFNDDEMRIFLYQDEKLVTVTLGLPQEGIAAEMPVLNIEGSSIRSITRCGIEITEPRPIQLPKHDNEGSQKAYRAAMEEAKLLPLLDTGSNEFPTLKVLETLNDRTSALKPYVDAVMGKSVPFYAKTLCSEREIYDGKSFFLDENARNADNLVHRGRRFSYMFDRPNWDEPGQLTLPPGLFFLSEFVNGNICMDPDIPEYACEGTGGNCFPLPSEWSGLDEIYNRDASGIMQCTKRERVSIENQTFIRETFTFDTEQIFSKMEFYFSDDKLALMCYYDNTIVDIEAKNVEPETVPDVYEVLDFTFNTQNTEIFRIPDQIQPQESIYAQ